MYRAPRMGVQSIHTSVVKTHAGLNTQGRPEDDG